MDLAEGLNRLRRQHENVRHFACSAGSASSLPPNCTCGADEANALIDELLARITDSVLVSRADLAAVFGVGPYGVDYYSAYERLAAATDTTGVVSR